MVENNKISLFCLGFYINFLCYNLDNYIFKCILNQLLYIKEKIFNVLQL